MNADADWTELMRIAERFASGDAELDELYSEAMHYFDHHSGPMPVAYRHSSKRFATSGTHSSPANSAPTNATA
ncbi:MAG: hypothetical protein U0V87_13875 [Acidobacteriota bacterium]